MVSNEEETPYNKNNVFITQKELENIIGFQPNTMDIYYQALTHRSYCTRKNDTEETGNTQCPKNVIPLRDFSQERLEYLGDAIIHSALSIYLYERYPLSQEDFLSSMRSKLENGDILAFIAYQIGLGKWVFISHQIEEKDGRKSNKILEDTYEAFIGAIFLDSDFSHAKDWFLNCVESYIDFAPMILKEVSSKDTFLKRYYYRFKRKPQLYQKENNDVPTIIIQDEKVISIGKGETIKEAERHASKKAMDFLQLNEPVFD